MFANLSLELNKLGSELFDSREMRAFSRMEDLAYLNTNITAWYCLPPTRSLHCLWGFPKDKHRNLMNMMAGKSLTTF